MDIYLKTNRAVKIAGLVRVVSVFLVLLTFIGFQRSTPLVRAQSPGDGNTYTVNTTDDNDDGICDENHCSLREAINAANADPAADMISFSIPGIPPYTIQPQSALPDISEPVTIDGTTQPDYPGNPIIELDGSFAGAVDGLVIITHESMICGLVINRFEGNGVLITGADATGNKVQGNFIGTDVTGTIDMGNLRGVFIVGGSDNLIGGAEPGIGNVLSGNSIAGVNITGGMGNLVQGNFIGTDANGTGSVDSSGLGVVIDGGATDTRIGGTAEGAGNIISGNTENGVQISDPDTTGNAIQGNYIGTDLTGIAPLPNKSNGIILTSGTHDNLIGGTDPGAWNLISGNAADGVAIFDTGTSSNIVQGNYIGTDATGTAAVGNSIRGVIIAGGATGNLIGGADSGAGNLISGNGAAGIRLTDEGTEENTVQGNKIGTDITGSSALGNGYVGIRISDGAANNEIGGTEDGARNVISGNNSEGVLLDGFGTSGNLVQGNYIGTDVTGSTASGPAGPDPGEFEVTVDFACPTYDPGTDFDGFISESDESLAPWSGTSVHFKGTDENGCGSPEMYGEAALIYRYEIVFAETTQLTSVAVSGAAFNGPDNVLRVLDADKNELGVAGTFGGNSFQTPFIALSDVEGTTFYIEEFDTSSTWRFRQSIVVNGPLPLGNRGFGVALGGGAADNLITGNLISGNRSDGVAIFNPGTSGNTLQGNMVGTDAGGNNALPNAGVGIWIGDGASNTLIGGAGEGEGNLISGNAVHGVSINNLETTGTQVLGNYIGTNQSGDAALPNEAGGVHVSTIQTWIGGSEPGDGNLISGNTGFGISITEEATENFVQGNYIGTDRSGSAALANSGPGIVISSYATGNLIGGTDPDAGNLISGNADQGIVIYGDGVSGNLVHGNFIGTDVSGSMPLGNLFSGIFIGGGATGNAVGGTEPDSGNVISGNGAEGVTILDPGTSWNVVQGNKIGADVTGEQPIPNLESGGIFLANGASENLIGGTDPGSGNIIAFNYGPGIAAHVEAGSGNSFLSNSISSNGGLGIDLGEDGITFNDRGDQDAGPNDLQNFPFITAVTRKGTSVMIHGWLLSTPGTTFRLEYFNNEICNTTGFGEGQTFLGSDLVITNRAGFTSFNITLPYPLPGDPLITATATDPQGSTSEFSRCIGTPPQPGSLWVATYTYDMPPGSWGEGVYPYHYEFEWNAPDPGSWVGQGGELVVSNEASLYPGYVLLRGFSELGRVMYPGGPTCEQVGLVHPDQPTRFLIGWLPDLGEMTYPQARAHFSSITARVVWGDGISAELVPHEIRPFSFENLDKWSDYVCNYTVRE